MGLDKKGRSRPGRPPNTTKFQNGQMDYRVKTPINQDLPSWESIFSMLGLPQPKRGRARCPIHDGDSPLSLAVNDERGVFYCHVCHESGDKISFIRKYFDCDFKGALAWFGLAPGKRPKPDPERLRRSKIHRNLDSWRRGESQKASRIIFNWNMTAFLATKRLKRDPNDSRAADYREKAYKLLGGLEDWHDRLMAARTTAELIALFRESRRSAWQR